jgi:hypothetical protein
MAVRAHRTGSVCRGSAQIAYAVPARVMARVKRVPYVEQCANVLQCAQSQWYRLARTQRKGVVHDRGRHEYRASH